MSEPRPLHRLFGLSWIDFFQGTSVDVETEMDLSEKQQFVDLVLIRRGPGPIPRRLPDGFEDLAAHNLVTFKSHQETLDGWALFELARNYENYRKQASRSLKALLPRTDFRLFAVCARFPQSLVDQVAPSCPQEAVFEVRALNPHVRIILVHQLPQEEHNAMLHLFSDRAELLRYGKEHYRPHSQETSSLLYNLFKAYSEETDMSDKLKQFVRETIDEMLSTLSAEERLKGLPAEELRKRLSAEERVEGLPAEERLKGLSADEVIRALPPETLEALTRQLKANGAPKKPQ